MDSIDRLAESGKYPREVGQSKPVTVSLYPRHLQMLDIFADGERGARSVIVRDLIENHWAEHCKAQKDETVNLGIG